MKGMFNKDVARARRVCRWVPAAALLSLIMGCSMNDALGTVPEAAVRLHVGPGADTQQLFDCARTRLAELVRQEALWDHEVTAQDVSQGVFETGNFAEDNVSGFRIQIRHLKAQGELLVKLRGAGAYYVDMGVDKALAEFREGFDTCAGVAAS